MALVFCDDGGSNTPPHASWAAAATTFLVAVDAAAAGDDIIIGHDHAETLTVNTTYTFPGTVSAHSRVISATSTESGSTVVYNKADNIQVEGTTNGVDIRFAGYVDMYGISMSVGDDFLIGTSPSRTYIEDSSLLLDSAGAILSLGAANGQIQFILKNTDVEWTNANNASFIQPLGVRFQWHGGTLSYGGTQPATSIIFGDDRNNFIDIHGVDFTAITVPIFNADEDADTAGVLTHCLINSSSALVANSVKSSGSTFLMSGCDDTTGNDLYRLEYIDYWGSTVHDDDIFRTTGGASGGTTPIA